MSPAGIHSLPAWRVSYGWVVLGLASVPSVVEALARTALVVAVPTGAQPLHADGR
jgi:hypothetical protein